MFLCSKIIKIVFILVSKAKVFKQLGLNALVKVTVTVTVEEKECAVFAQNLSKNSDWPIITQKL